MNVNKIKNTKFADSLSEMYEILKGTNILLAELMKFGEVSISDSLEVCIIPEKFESNTEIIKNHLSSSAVKEKVHKIYEYQGFKFTIPIKIYHKVTVMKIFKRRELILALGDQSRSMCDLLMSFISIFKGIKYDISNVDPTPLIKKSFIKKYTSE